MSNPFGNRLKIIREWVAALRSGDYDQGKGALCKPNVFKGAKYCCLGVLCEIVYGEDAWDLPSHRYVYVVKDSSTTYLPLALDKYVLNEEPDLYSSHGPFEQVLANLNDTGHTFEEIADRIEKELL